MELEESLRKIITTKSIHTTTFLDMVSKFEEKLSDFAPVKNCIDIEKYFSNRSKASIIQEINKDYPLWFRESKADFKGIYIFICEKEPFYIGISKGVIGRILQHIKGANHYSATLAYNIGRTISGHKGTRKELEFATHVKPCQKFLLQQKIAFLPIENDEELYLFEVYCAMEFRCTLNTFETH